MMRKINLVFAAVFALLGLASLLGAIFFKAYHQFGVAAVMSLLVWFCIDEARTEKQLFDNYKQDSSY